MDISALSRPHSDTIWWQDPAINSNFKKTIRQYCEYREMVMCEKCLKFDSQFDALASLLLTYRMAFFSDATDPLICFCGLFENAIPEKRKKKLISTIDKIGFEKIQNAFDTLTQVCEKKYQEKEDLFAILKRHRLNFPAPGSDQEKLYRVSQFLNVALINQNLMKKKGQSQISEKLLKLKYEAALVIMPLIDEIFYAVFGKEVLRSL